MPRLKRVDCAGPGIARKRRGRGFIYVWPDGAKVTERDVLDRIKSLVVPPAWKHVWICEHANGHIQAVGTDDAGRRQYLYHDAWRETRDREKHDRILTFARHLPKARRTVARDLDATGYAHERVLAAAFRLSGRQAQQRIVAADVVPVVTGLLRRKHDSPELLAYKRGGRWHNLRSEDVNAYVRKTVGNDTTAKDFRTWHATVLMAVALAASREGADSPAKRKRAVARAYREAAEYLGKHAGGCEEVLRRPTRGGTVRRWHYGAPHVRACQLRWRRRDATRFGGASRAAHAHPGRTLRGATCARNTLC